MPSFDPELLQHCWFLAGPTASGKSAVALELAPQLNAEIVALDSMTLYRGMDIGTAKPTAAERAAVPHHLFDILDPTQEFSVAEYVAAAQQCSRDITTRGRVPLFVGGTGLYLRSVLRGVLAGPPAQPELRAELEAAVERAGPEELHRRLMQVDAVAAARLHPHDVRRVIRALEVHAITGRPLSDQHEHGPLPAEVRPRHVYWLHPPRSWLHQRINQRVLQMVQNGLLDEVKSLPQPLSRTARQALGYKEVLDWLEQPHRSWNEVVTLIQTRTRQFAKRQCTWFRNLAECTEIAVSGNAAPAEIVRRLLRET
jgi:tRNA dimethylallyltransferase